MDTMEITPSTTTPLETKLPVVKSDDVESLVIKEINPPINPGADVDSLELTATDAQDDETPIIDYADIDDLCLATESVSGDSYFVEGSSRLPTPLTLETSGLKLTLPAGNFTKATEAVTAFLPACEPAPFGQGNQTVLDQSVRKAWQVKAENLQITGFEPTPEMLESIRAKLVPDAPHIVCELHKLNVYGKDGFFLKHRDTPRDTQMFGSLVVCLPSMFLGGELVIRHDGHQKVCEWDKRMQGGYSRGLDEIRRHLASNGPDTLKPWDAGKYKEWATGTPPANVHWVAFYGDCEHEINKVVHGHRMTLTYILSRSADCPAIGPKSDAMLLARANNLKSVMQRCLRNPDFFPEAGKMAFACKHSYEISDISHESMAPLPKSTSCRQLRLKGADALIAVAASALDLTVRTAWVINEEVCDGEDKFLRSYPFDPKKSLTSMAYIENEFKARAMDVGKLDNACLSEEDIENLEWCFHGAKNAKENKEFILRDIFYNEDMYFGNEACVTSFYTKAVLIVDVPAWTEQRGQAVADVDVQGAYENKENVPGPALPAKAAQAIQKRKTEWPPIPELKRACRKFGLKVGGTKGDLIERLTEANKTPADI